MHKLKAWIELNSAKIDRMVSDLSMAIIAILYIIATAIVKFRVQGIL